MGRVLQPFAYDEPTTLGEALAVIADPDAKIIAGGCDLVPAMRRGILRPSRVVSIGGIPDLNTIAIDDRGGLRIGPLATIRALAGLACFRNGWGALFDAIDQIQPADITGMGTVVGNLCSARPFTDIPVALTCLRAEAQILSIQDQRQAPISSFYRAWETTDLRSGELVSSVAIPPMSGNAGSAFRRLYKAPRRERDLHKVSAACAITIDPATGKVREATIVVGGCSYGPLRMRDAEATLEGAPLTREAYARAAELSATGIPAMVDAPWVEESRKAFVRILVRDTLEEATIRARSGNLAPDPPRRKTQVERDSDASDRSAGASTLRGRSAIASGFATTKRIATFRVNGRDRDAVIEPHMLLVDVLRDHLGLTGAKRGCATGHCGTCTVLVDEVPIRSCISLAIMATGKSITTVEGLAGPGGALHPLQRAFVDHGASQCGYCTPGMLLAAKALLAVNPIPTRSDIKQAIAGNICRCTGYLKIIDAVLAASSGTAERNEVPGVTDAFSYIGKSLRRPDVAAKVTGEAKYTEDIIIPGMIEGRILRSPHPHAKMRLIDTSRAKALPGVAAVITHKDVPRSRFTRSTMAEALSESAYGSERQDQYILSEKARYIGDWVAAVAADDIYIAEKALELIEVDYEPLPAIFDPFAALKPAAPQIHDDALGNVAFEADHRFNCGDVDRAIGAADAVIEFSGASSRQKHLHLETDAAIAWWDANERLTVISPAQGPHLAKKHLAKRIFTDIDEGDIRWISPAIGGSFGARMALGVEPVAVLLAKLTGKPVRVTTTREEDFSGYSSRTDQHQTIRLAAKRDGTITAIEQQIVADSGAYLSHSGTTSMVNLKHTLGLFRCANIRGHVKVAYTNTPTTSGFRGYGNPEGAFVLQQAVDMLAEKLGIDPVEFRLRNIRREGEPSLLATRPIEHTRLDECIRLAARRFDWKNKWRGWSRERNGRLRRGVGMSILVNSTSAGGGLLEHSNAIIKVMADGSANLIVSPSEMGQGILGGLQQVAAETSGLKFEAVRIVTGDTDATLFDIGSHASRSMLAIGNAVAAAGVKIKDQIRALAVPHFAKRQAKVTGDELDLREGLVFLKADPSIHVEVGEIAHNAIYNFGSTGAQIVATGSYLSTANHPSHQAAFAEIEVDTATGVIRVLHYVLAHDIGRAINPQLVEGQMEGGVVQGLGFALTEDFTVDPDTGRVLSDSLFSYRLPSVMDVPEMEKLLVEDPAPFGPFGAKGVGEAPITNPAAAIANAVYDALGVRIHSLPIAPDKVLYALRSEGEVRAAGSSRVTGQFL